MRLRIPGRGCVYRQMHMINLSRCGSDGLKIKTFNIGTKKVFSKTRCVPFPSFWEVKVGSGVLKRMVPKGVIRTQALLVSNESGR